MNPTVSIFVAATPLLASSGAEAARGTAGGSTNLDAAAHSPSQHSSTPYQPYRRRVHRPGVGALPGAPGSSTYDPFGALPSLNNPGSPLAPTPGTSAAGIIRRAQAAERRVARQVACKKLFTEATSRGAVYESLTIVGDGYRRPSLRLNQNAMYAATVKRHSGTTAPRMTPATPY